MQPKQSLYARYGFRIILIAVFLAPIVALGARSALKSNTNDVREWLPKDYGETAEYSWFQQHFGNEEFVVVTWEGCTPEDPRLELLTRKFDPEEGQVRSSTGEPLIKRVVTGRTLIDELKKLNLSDEEVAKRLKGTLLGPDGQQTCALLTLTDTAKQHLKATIAAVREIANQCGITDDKLRLGGPPVVNAAIDVSSANSLSRLATLSGIVGLIIAWWCFRTLRMTAMVFVTGLYSAAASLAVVAYSGVSMNAILMTMAPLVYVAGMSGAIHLANYYRDAVRDFGRFGAASKAIKHARVPLALATSTTAIGLLSLCYSELLPIRMFGLYSAIGVVISVLFLFFVLPALLELWPPKERLPDVDVEQPHDEGEDILSPGWRRFAEGVIRYHGWVTAGALAVLVFCAVGLTHVETSIKIMRFFSRDSEIIHTYRWIESNLGAMVPMEVILRLDKEKCKLEMLEKMELVDHVQHRIATLHDVGSTLSAVTFAPSLPKRKNWPEPASWSDRRGVLERKLVKNFDRFEKTGYLAENDEEELWRISVRVGALNDVDYGEFVKEIQARVNPVLQAQRDQGYAGIDATFTGMVPVVYKAQRSLLDGLIFGFTTDLILIVVAIIVLMLHWSPGVMLTLTSLFPTTVVFGLMGWLGIIVDIGTVMTPSVALGVTVDDVVHFLLKFQKGIQRGLTRQEAVMLAYQGCARAMYQSWGVIGLGLSMFSFSSFTPTLRFGALMVTLLTVGLVGNLVFLPALMSGPLGGLISASVRARAARAERRRARRHTRLDTESTVQTGGGVELFVRPDRRSVKT